MTGQVITATAQREPQECMASVSIATQPLKRAVPAQYKVTLRTLRSIAADSYDPPAYADYQRVGYELDPANPDFLRLAIATASLEAGAQAIVAEWTASPRGAPIHRQGVAALAADTFDWWIPVSAPFSIDSAAHVTLAEMHAYGQLASQIVPKPPPSPPGGAESAGSTLLAINEITQGGYIPQLTWPSYAQDWKGQQREMIRKTVQVEYVLDWNGAKLDISIKGDPADRSYVVYAVVEEKLTGSGNVLHTAVALPVNGLLTYVPQQFFDDESGRMRSPPARSTT
jgi:hypothetical protein